MWELSQLQLKEIDGYLQKNGHFTLFRVSHQPEMLALFSLRVCF